ncbi:MAG TPA: hypothetical protein VGK67_12295 [Myxococcales bacterium]|jgi:hypothetical protein
MKWELRGAWALCVLACVSSGEARAEEEAVDEALLSARPTLYLGDANAEGGYFGAGLHLGLTGRSPEFGPNLRAEAELSLLIAKGQQSTAIAFEDNSSWLRLSWRPEGWALGEGLAFTLLPLHSDRLFLGWEYPVASSLALSGTSGTTTGADLRLSREGWYAFVSAKSLMRLDDKVHEQFRKFTVLGGGGYDVLRVLRLEVQAAYAELGVNPTTSVLGKPVDEAALAARASYHYGLPVGPPSDWQRFRNDPAVWEKLLRPEVYPGGLAVTAAVEGLYVQQRGLADPDEFGKTLEIPSSAVAGEVRVRWDELRAFARAQHRTLSFLGLSVPGFPPFHGFPDGTRLAGETTVSAAVDYHFERAHLTPGIGGGVVLPATYTTSGDMGGNNPPPQPAAERTVVVSDGYYSPSILPSGVSARPIWNAALTLRLDFERISAIAEGVYTRNANRYTFKDTAEGVPEPTALDPSVFGFHFLVQARF